MELDLYQRRGMYGLGDATTDATSGITSSIASLGSGIDLSSMSPTTLLVAGAFGLWILSSVFSGGKRAYSSVARPIGKYRKKRKRLKDVDESYRSERKRISES